MRRGGNYVRPATLADQPSKTIVYLQVRLTLQQHTVPTFDGFVLEPLIQREDLQLFAFLCDQCTLVSGPSRLGVFGAPSRLRCRLCFDFHGGARSC